jgi:signal transduction histidine kinase
VITPGHKRVLNRALHELRRPLQALLLLEDADGRPAAAPPAASRRGLLELATNALQDLDGALNGGAPSRASRRFSCRESVMACLERWRIQAQQAGGVRVYWDAGPAVIEGDPAGLAQALDNLLANAVEHGGPPIVITGARVAGRVRITIANGVRPRLAARSSDPRRGHGTGVVSETANAHGGRFVLCETASGCVAALELPLAEPGYAALSA